MSRAARAAEGARGRDLPKPARSHTAEGLRPPQPGRRRRRRARAGPQGPTSPPGRATNTPAPRAPNHTLHNPVAPERASPERRHLNNRGRPPAGAAMRAAPPGRGVTNQPSYALETGARFKGCIHDHCAPPRPGRRPAQAGARAARPGPRAARRWQVGAWQPAARAPAACGERRERAPGRPRVCLSVPWPERPPTLFHKRRTSVAEGRPPQRIASPGPLPRGRPPPPGARPTRG